MVARLAGAQVIHLAINLGIGGAVQTGLRWALGHDFEYFIQVDGDGQHDPASILDLIRPLVENSADVVIGSRLLTRTGFKPVPLRLVGVRWFSFLCGRKVKDVTSGFRALTRRAAEILVDDYPKDYPEPLTIVRARRRGLRLVEVPVRMRRRTHGRSSINIWAAIGYVTSVSLGILLEYSLPKEGAF